MSGAWGIATWDGVAWDRAPAGGGAPPVPVGITDFTSVGRARGIDPGRSGGRQRGIDPGRSTGEAR